MTNKEFAIKSAEVCGKKLFPLDLYLEENFCDNSSDGGNKFNTEMFNDGVYVYSNEYFSPHSEEWNPEENLEQAMELWESCKFLTSRLILDSEGKWLFRAIPTVHEVSVAAQGDTQSQAICNAIKKFWEKEG